MVLTTLDKAQAPVEAKRLLNRAQAAAPDENRVIIDIVVTIISYRFGQITRQEVEKMLDITFEETRYTKKSGKKGCKQDDKKGCKQDDRRKRLV